MSKLIVEMGMPYRCPCEFAVDNNGWFSPCFGYYGIPSRAKDFEDCIENGTRPSWCPIKGVLPDEHGDLIDRDALLLTKDKYGKDVLCVSKNTIAKMQAVIAAERKEDEHHGS